MKNSCDLLAQKDCIPCKGGIPPLPSLESERLLSQLGHDWVVIDNHHLEKTFAFPNFLTALDFTVKIGAVAEKEGHHPDIYLAWGKVGIKIWTHKINGLTESDFVLAAKVETLPKT